MVNKKKAEGNAYDKIFKENAESIFKLLAEEKFNLKIESYQPLAEKLQSTIEREMDFLYKVKTVDKEEFLLHIEFQKELDDKMLYRIGEYHGMAQKRHQLSIKHLVIHTEKRKPNIRTQLKKDELFLGYEVIDLYDLDPYELIASQVPEFVLLAVLANIPKEKSESILRLIIRKLKVVCQHQDDLEKHLKQLTIFSRLRNLNNTTQQILDTMSLQYDIENDSVYKLGVQKGKELSQEALKKAQQEKEQEFQKAQQKKEQEFLKILQQEKQKALQEKQKALQEKQKALQEKQENIRQLLKLEQFSDKKIAEILNVSTYLVRKIKKQSKN